DLLCLQLTHRCARSRRGWRPLQTGRRLSRLRTYRVMARVFDAPIITNDQNIDRLLAVPLPVLILFWKDIIPEQVNQSMKQLAAREAGQLIVAKVYTRDNPGVARDRKSTRLNSSHVKISY